MLMTKLRDMKAAFSGMGGTLNSKRGSLSRGALRAPDRRIPGAPDRRVPRVPNRLKEGRAGRNLWRDSTRPETARDPSPSRDRPRIDTLEGGRRRRDPLALVLNRSENFRRGSMGTAHVAPRPAA